jgi:DnaJ-class molecular chaperone
MKETLYDILGVTFAAELKTIKAGYRNRVKDCHPDKFPNDDAKRAEFERVQRAYDILSDPERRTKYDENGDTSDEVPDDKPVRILMNVFEEVVNRRVAPTKDYVELMREILTESLKEVKAAISENEKSKRRYNILIKKFKNKKSPKDNMFKSALESKLRDCAEKEASIIGASAGIEAALLLLTDYEFEVDPQPTFNPFEGLKNSRE